MDNIKLYHKASNGENMSEQEGSAAEVAVDEVLSDDVEDQIEESYEIVEDEEVSDEVEAAAEAIEDAIEDGATEEEVQELIETFKLKVNGEEREVTLDWNNKDDIVKRLQLAEASQEAMKRSAELEKTFDREINRLQKNPWEVLQEMGIDPDTLAEERIQQTIEQLQKSPEQLAREERDAELETLRAKLKAKEEEQDAVEMKRLENEAAADLRASIDTALSATTKLPKSEYVERRIADTMLSFLDEGYTDITVADVVPIVEKEYLDERRQVLDSLSDEELVEYLGKKTVDRLRKQRLKKMPKTVATKDTGKTTETKKAVKRISMRDFLK